MSENDSLPMPADPVPVVPAAADPNLPVRHQPVASYLHTALIIALLILVGMMSGANTEKFSGAKSPVGIYFSTLIWLWLLFIFVAVGIKQRGHRLRDIIGPRIKGLDDLLMDVVYAGLFWFVAVGVLAALGKLLGLATGDAVKEAQKMVQAMAPTGIKQIALWFVVSMSAGFVEEFVFRGYLQRQFLALTQRTWLAVLLPSAVFAVGHLYQGTARAVVIGIFGSLFGILAAWRKSLRPGMMAHAWHDIFTGLVMSFLKK